MIENKIRELGFELPEAPKPVAAYMPSIKINDLVYTAGQVPVQNGELKFRGKVGKTITEEDGQKAAEICALNCLAAIKSVLGNLNKVEQIIKLTVFVNSADGFTRQPQVANGASEFLVKVFGDKGKHVRSAVGVNELPLNAAIEIEMICKVSG